jgi:hypothetical protein
MKIGSHIKPRSGKARHVPLYGTEYVFAPMKDKHGVTHFVADVANVEHAATLLENGAFYAFDKAQMPGSQLQRGGQKPADPPPPPGGPFTPEVEAEAKALLDNNVDALNVAVGKVSGLDVVRCALQLEHAGSARKTAVAVLEATLAAAAEAGVKA